MLYASKHVSVLVVLLTLLVLRNGCGLGLWHSLDFLSYLSQAAHKESYSIQGGHVSMMLIDLDVVMYLDA